MYKRSSLGVYLPLTCVTVGLTGDTIYRAPVADCTRKINSPPVFHSDVLQKSIFEDTFYWYQTYCFSYDKLLTYSKKGF